MSNSTYVGFISDVIIGTVVSQITSPNIVYWIVYSGADQRRHQSSASLAFVWGIHRWPVISPHKWSVTWKMYPFEDVIIFPVYSVVQNFKRFFPIWHFLIFNVMLPQNWLWVFRVSSLVPVSLFSYIMSKCTVSGIRLIRFHCIKIRFHCIKICVILQAQWRYIPW